ncbi:DMT family transporter [Ancylobacter oerskovii]|uniref:DMT family transporter n=1 Tax=Ancylobacter oerskovii TaxID=459519 RepID=A0ABW4YWK4_9HYPH|nr:DMT family transporter [Ancylobacter oerskovii]MBS7544114.1 DMT family transporter [Ancylobacter oerskovii]
MPRLSGRFAGAEGRTALLLVAMLLFALSDVAAKQLGGRIPAIQIAWARYAVASVILASICVLFGLRPGKAQARRSQLLRGLGMAGATLFQIAALHRLPLADATALYFVSPLLVTLLAALVLREAVRPAQWCAVLLGLAGVLVVVKPGDEGLSLFALLPLGSALCWAAAIVSSRPALRRDTVLTTLAWSAGLGLVVSSAGVVPVFATPTAGELLWLAGLGLCWAGAHALVACAYQGEAVAVARLAPLSYTYLVWTLGLGEFVLGERPGASTLFGVLLIVVAGIWSQASGRGGAPAGRPLPRAASEAVTRGKSAP